MFQASTVMIPFETWCGIAVIGFSIAISIQAIRRKISLKQIVSSIILFTFSLFFLYINIRDIDIVNNFDALVQSIKSASSYKTFLPFGWLFTSKLGNLKAAYIPVITSQYISTFLFSVALEILLSVRYNNIKNMHLIVIGVIILVPIEVLIFVESYISGYNVFFDTGNIVLIVLGLYCGITIKNYFKDRRRKNGNG